jgi:fimbrial chaperone protein
MKTMRTLPARGLLLAALLATCGAAGATGLQVAPISLQLQATQTADGLWLSNSGDTALHAQVRVYHWTQAGGTEQLTPSRGLVISPPMLGIDGGQRQLVRVIRVGAPPSGAAAVEDAYRVVVDELPVDADTSRGVQFVLRYSVPVFVEPAGKDATAPKLAWSLHREGDSAVLDVANSGDGHAQISQLVFTDSNGKHIPLSNGLLGYVLPGAHMRWTLEPDAGVFAAGGTFNARINGEPVAQPISLDAAR